MKHAIYQKPTRRFEEQGIVVPAKSYYVPLDHVVNTHNQDLKTMVEEGRYFTIFAPRQSGKTTFFKDFCRHLESDSAFIALLLSFQSYKTLDSELFYRQIEKRMYPQLLQRLQKVNSPQLQEVEALLHQHRLSYHIAFAELFETLNRLLTGKKIVIFIDEFDGIPAHEVENFLTVLRELYQQYKDTRNKALYSVGLVGIRNMTKLVVGGVSPFNIADQVKLPPFSLRNIEHLYAQYSAETHQPFTEDAVNAIYRETSGQPWLVNRLGTILTVNIKSETIAPITSEDVGQAIQLLLKEKNAHFDNLLEKAKSYKETFVNIVFNGVRYNPDDDDQSWLEQYGLIREEHGHACVANPIYQQRFLNAFFHAVEAENNFSQTRYYSSDGGLDMGTILADFEEYIVQIGINAFYERQKPYEKTGKYLLTAWLYQFVQGGKGTLRYETPTGPGIMDILLTYQGRKYIIETKLNRWKLQTTLENACQQVAGKYLLPERVNEGYLVIFDLKTNIGAHLEPQQHLIDGKDITSVVIGIRRPSDPAI